MSNKLQSDLTNKEIYKLFLLLQSYDEIKRAILMVLLHIYPKEINGNQLAVLAGYSSKSKYIFKSGALEMLEQENIITISKPSKRLFLIKLHEHNELLTKFAQVCQTEGKSLQELFLGKLLNDE